MMRRWTIIGILFTLLMVGCHREDVVTTSGPCLNVAIDFPQMRGTKAEQEALSDENAIYSLSVWVFRSDTHTSVGSLFLTESNQDQDNRLPTDGGLNWYKLSVPVSFVNTHPNVDVFVLANAASIGCTLDGDATWDDVTSACFGEDETHDYFGVTTLTMGVPENVGLPMSGRGYGLQVYGDFPTMKVSGITIQRAVSRLRLVFCKTATEDEGNGGEEQSVSVDGIVFYKEQIPLQEYVFIPQDASNGVVLTNPVTKENYVSIPFSYPAIQTLYAHEAPESLVYINQDPDAYQAILNEAAHPSDPNETPTVTDLGYTYLRETDLRLAGRVDYTIGETSSFREFSMPTRGGFLRNHTWTLFAYFMGGRNLQLSLVALPWDKGDYTVDFSEQSITVTSKFTVDANTAELSLADDGYTEVQIIPGTPAKAHLRITTPVGGSLMIYPKGAATLFKVSPEQHTIDPSRNSGQIDIEITNNPDAQVDLETLSAAEKMLTLSFTVEAHGREISADSEIIDTKYRFKL